MNPYFPELLHFNIDEPPEMATFASSFMPINSLAPRYRFGMPGSSLSNLSESSLRSSASGRAGDIFDFDFSRPATPSFHAPLQTQSQLYAEERAPTPFSNSVNVSVPNSPRFSTSRPIAIEIPRLGLLNTLPEPLSARGDRAGGYFPLHEDPDTRIHRTHPFHHRGPTDTNNMTEQDQTTFDLVEVPASVSASVSVPAPVPESYIGPAPVPQTAHQPSEIYSAEAPSVPVASYIPPGCHDTAIPMGKYYPSNYEKRYKKKKARTSKSDTPASGSRPEASDSAFPSSADEMRRKMRQYQRDMVMQAAMALGDTAANASLLAAGITLSDADLRLISAAQQHKPKSPRLLPLGSPGPVTPMELESSSEGGYIGKGKEPERPSGDSSAPPNLDTKN